MNILFPFPTKILDFNDGELNSGSIIPSHQHHLDRQQKSNVDRNEERCVDRQEKSDVDRLGKRCVDRNERSDVDRQGKMCVDRQGKGVQID